MTRAFSTTGGISHSTSIVGLTGGSTYVYYVRCKDTAGNKNTADFFFAFNVAVVLPNPNVFIIEDDASFDGSFRPSWDMTKKFYATYPDSYDFIALFHQVRGSGKRAGFDLVQRNFEPINPDTNKIFAAQYGSNGKHIYR